MSNSDLLKEAIADAKAVRETALANAKMALEEAFTPQLKSMLSAKLKEEEDDDEAEEGRMSDDADDDETEEGRMSKDEADDEDEAEEGHMEEDEEDTEAEEGVYEDEDEDEVEEELDLEAVIRELESEISEGEDEEDEEVEESVEEVEEEYEIDEAALEEDEEDEELDEVDKSSDIGKSDNNRGDTDKSSDIGGGDNKLSEVVAELHEYKEAVHFLKDKLHEVNILNAKLLFTNKLFKQYSLNNNQKLKVVETFDRAQTTREIKLVYSTLAEQFGDNSTIVTKKSIKESASSAVASTKPSKESRKVITEENKVANRFRKLAGLDK